MKSLIITTELFKNSQNVLNLHLYKLLRPGCLILHSKMYFNDSYKGEKFGQRKTYLSSNVKKLVCYELEGCATQTHDKLFLKDGMLDWDEIENECNLKECFSSPDDCDYQLAVSRLYPVSSAIQDYLFNLTKDDFEKQYKIHLKWTAKSDLLLHCFDLLKSPHAGCLEASLLLVTSTLERILGDIFMTCSNAVQCPSLLKDLLEMNELKKALGETVMRCLEVYIGPPAGLNLRNLAWHGFLSQRELLPSHVSFLIMLTISLAEVIKTTSTGKTVTKLKERPLITYSKTDLLQDVFPEVQTNGLLDLFHKSHFVTSSMVEVWKLALDFYDSERFGDVVILMLPQLEHSLRRLYACCNDVPERLQTAESAEFYTTFNEILSPVLADGTSNKLLKVIGTSLTEILLDILVHQQGPRLRDHLSHGEIDTQQFPKYLTNHILCVSIAFCEKFSPESENPSSARLRHFPEISQVAHLYSSVFHPLSWLQRSSLTYISDLLEWKKLPKPHGEDFGCSSHEITDFWETIRLVLNNVHHDPFLAVNRVSTEEGNSEVLQTVLEILTMAKLSTLFRPRHELEIVALLRNIVDHCSQASKQIQQTAKSRYEEYQKKELRSRQRNNYRRFWLQLPFIERIMSLFAVIVVAEMSSVENIQGHNESHVKFLKRCLQCAENLASLSSSSRNRWQECAEVGKLWMEQAHNYYERTLT